jgi:hypothetical protein
MDIRRLGSNQTLVYLNNGNVVLFSYNTPVAAYVTGRGYVQTNQHYNMTTTKHIHQFSRNCERVEQEYIDNLLK